MSHRAARSRPLGVGWARRWEEWRLRSDESVPCIGTHALFPSACGSSYSRMRAGIRAGAGLPRCNRRAWPRRSRRVHGQGRVSCNGCAGRYGGNERSRSPSWVKARGLLPGP